MNYYYIYIFFDPTDPDKKEVFYCGRGTGNRPKGHLNQAGVSIVSNPVEGDVFGASAEDVLYVEQQQETVEQCATPTSKVQKIKELTSKKVTPAQMIRVIATGLSSELAKTMESFFIHAVFGTQRLETGKLLNIASGEGRGRFRPKGDLNSIGWVGAENASHEKQYYTYVLRNPKTNTIEYVGKGKSDRCFAHFKDLDSITPEEMSKKQKALKDLLDQGFKENEIVRLIAVGLNEDEALAIESACIKYVFGPSTNAVMGHHPERFRAINDWELRIGFDIPFLAAKGGAEARQLELEQWLGQGYMPRFEVVVAPYSDLQFSELFNHGAGSPAIAATVYGGGGNRNAGGDRLEVGDEGGGEERGTIYVFSHSPIDSAISVEIRWHGKQQIQSFKKKFRTFKKEEWATTVATTEDINYLNRRREMVFLPDPWAGKPAQNLETAIKRLGWMIALLQTSSLDELKGKIGEGATSELLGVDEDIRLELEVKRYERSKTLALKNGSPVPSEPTCVQSNFYLVGTSFRKANSDGASLLGWHFSIERCHGVDGPVKYDESHVSKLRQEALNSCRRDADVNLFEWSDFDYFDSEMLVENKTLKREKIKKRLKAFIPRLVNAQPSSKLYKQLKEEFPYNWSLSADGFSIFATDVPAEEGDLLFETVGLNIAKYLNQSADSQ